MVYFQVPKQYVAVATIGLLILVGVVNHFGPKHSGSMALSLAIPAVVMVLIIVALSVPHLSTAFLQPPRQGFVRSWDNFVGVILALSGVEAIANLTGVMKLDPGSTPEAPKVTRTATKAIVLVAIEVVAGTALIGWAMLSLPKTYAPELEAHKEDMLRFVGENYATLAGAEWFRQAVSVV